MTTSEFCDVNTCNVVSSQRGHPLWMRIETERQSWDICPSCKDKILDAIKCAGIDLGEGYKDRRHKKGRLSEETWG